MAEKPTDFPTEPIQFAAKGDALNEDHATVVVRAFEQESDRGCAIFGAAMLENDLEALLRAFCRQDDASIKQVINPLFNTYAPLATFSAKIQVTFALRLITQNLRRKLDIVRRLRNDFAHEPGPLTFEAPGCHDRVRLLIADGKPLVPSPDDLEFISGGDRTTKRQFRNRLAFIIAVSQISAQIEFIKGHAEAGQDPRLTVDKLEAGGLRRSHPALLTNTESEQ